MDYQALADFRYELRRYLNFASQAARRMGVQPKQYQAMLAIKGGANGLGATVSQLAEQMQIEHHSAVELSGRLAQKGWILRSRSRVDRREVLLRLTPRGEKLLRHLSVSHHQELELAGPRLIRTLQSIILREAKNKRRVRRRSPSQTRSNGDSM
jgi:DNA-binding MarR family transcriptional regulator